MKFNKAFYLTGCGLLLIAAFIFLSPSFVSSDLLFPLRYDSLYVVYQSQHSSEVRPAVFNPGDLSMNYEEFTVNGADNCRLRGWFVPADDTSSDQTLLLLHDINQSRIRLLESIRQFHDRGFNVCTYDLRAHGSSEGKMFSLGSQSLIDLEAVTTLLRANGIERTVICASGLSCPIACLYVLAGGSCDALVLESPFSNLETYLRRHAAREWGVSSSWWYPILERQVAAQLQVPVYQIDLRTICSVNKLPTLVIAGTRNELVYTTESFEVYDRCAAPQKDLLLVKDAQHGEYYYNGISSFVNTVMPRRQKTSNRKRLALTDDSTGNDRPHPGDRTH